MDGSSLNRDRDRADRLAAPPLESAGRFRLAFRSNIRFIWLIYFAASVPHPAI